MRARIEAYPFAHFRDDQEENVLIGPKFSSPTFLKELDEGNVVDNTLAATKDRINEIFVVSTS